MATIRKLITTALRNLAVVSANSVPTAEDISVSLQAFNALIDSLSTDILNIHTVLPYRFPVVAGKNTYTLGPALDDNGLPTNADWVISRPMRIENAVLLVNAPTTEVNGQVVIGETSSTLFFDLQLLNFSQYAGITVRKLETTWPTSLFDNGAYPLRTLKLWPVPEVTLACELWLWEPLATYASLDDELNLPPGYERYLVLKLAKEVCPEFGANWTNTLEARLQESESGVKTLNQQTNYTKQSGPGRNVTNRTPPYATSDGKYTRTPRVG